MAYVGYCVVPAYATLVYLQHIFENCLISELYFHKVSEPFTRVFLFNYDLRIVFYVGSRCFRKTNTNNQSVTNKRYNLLGFTFVYFSYISLKEIPSFFLCSMSILDCSSRASVNARQAHGAVAVPLWCGIAVHGDVLHRAIIHACSAMRTFVGRYGKLLVTHAVTAEPRVDNARLDPSYSSFHHIYFVGVQLYLMGDAFYTAYCVMLFLFFKFLAVDIKSWQKNVVVWHLYRIRRIASDIT